MALLAALLLAPARALALGLPDDHDRVLRCRPTIACTAELASPGTLEVETGYIDRAAGAGAAQRSFPFLLKLTLATWGQVQIGSNGYTVAQRPRTERFFDDVTVGLKLHLADQGPVQPAVSLSATLSVPTPAGQQGYVRTYDAFLVAYASKDVGPVHGHLNVGFSAWRSEDRALPALAGAGPLRVAHRRRAPCSREVLHVMPLPHR
jgi:hypothetical protein